jgi:uncharacterized membrane protein YfcA
MNGSAHAADLLAPRPLSIAREFFQQQAPFIAGALLLGYGAALLQHGFVPGSDAAYPLAGVRVPVWHVVWMGMWTGYTMALVGQAAGILALPYTTSFLQFSNAHVSPSTLLLTFLNPIGALLGFRRTGQWNLDFASWLCAGGAVGGLIGPFTRATLLSDAASFRLVLGCALAFVGVQLSLKALGRNGRMSKAPGGAHLAVRTLSWIGSRLTIGYRDQQWTVNQWLLFAVGAAVGIVSSALGLGGAFLIVPFLVIFYRLPMHVVPAATIPYAVVLSAVGLFTYCAILPLAGTPAIQPEWAWGFFAAAGGIFGSWTAAKTQRYLPESLLDAMLGALTGAASVIYILSFFVELPFKV